MKNVLAMATTFPRWENDTEPNFVFKLSSLLSKNGYGMTILAPHYPNAKRFETIGKLKIYRFPYFYPLKLQKLCYDGGILENIKKSLLAKVQIPLLLLSEYFYAKKIVKKERIDIIHAHWIIPQGLIAAIIKKLYNIPFISTAHAGDVFPIKKNILKAFAGFAIKNSSCITANSSFTKNAILEICDSKNIDVIPMGVDLNEFSPGKKDAKLRMKFGIKGKLILFVGRLAEKKGVEYLVRAMPSVLKSLPGSKLIIVGDGPEMKNLARLAGSLNLENYIVFAGKLSSAELPKFYAAADVFVGPSIVTKKGDTEGLGIVFLEAMASGTSVIGSNVGGIPDIIKHNKTGILVEQKNAGQLASAIVNLLKNKKLQRKLAKNAMAHIKNNYSWGAVAKKFAMAYAKVK